MRFNESSLGKGVTKFSLYVPVSCVADDAEYVVAEVCRSDFSKVGVENSRSVVVVDILNDGDRGFSRKSNLDGRV